MKRTSKDHDKSGIDWAVYQVMRDMDAAGVYPSGDALCAKLEDYTEDAVRASRMRLLNTAGYAIKTPPPCADHEASEPDPAAAGVWIDDEAGGPPTFKLGANPERALDIAMLRIVDGLGGIEENLSILTHLSVNAVKSRVCRARLNATAAELKPREAAFSPSEARYFDAVSKKMNDPAVREFIGIHNAPVRRRPGGRSSADKSVAC